MSLSEAGEQPAADGFWHLTKKTCTDFVRTIIVLNRRARLRVGKLEERR